VIKTNITFGKFSKLAVILRWIDSLILFPFKNSLSQSKNIVPTNIPIKKSTEPYMNPRIKSAKFDSSDV
jgi:hypothetical protein